MANRAWQPKKQSLQLVNFNKGLITEANPLNQPLGSTRDERNFTLRQDGVRARRLGMDKEEGGNYLNFPGLSGIMSSNTNIFEWDLSGDFDGLKLVVVQVRNKLFYFDTSTGVLSDINSVKGTTTLSGEPQAPEEPPVYSMTQVNNLLVVATGSQIVTIEYDGDSDQFYSTQLTLQVRDFFGLEDIHDPLAGGGPIDIGKGNDVGLRPPMPGDSAIEDIADFTTAEHVYNLYNQGWPKKDVRTYSATTLDKILRNPYLVCHLERDVLPSNTDIYSQYVSLLSATDPSYVESYNTELMESGLELTSLAPRGRNIISLLERGASRAEVYESDDELTMGFLNIGRRFSDSDVMPQDFPLDTTTGSANVVEEYAGRVFYAGFSGSVLDGDINSPSLNNYVAFSQLVTDVTKASQCYQVADPTAKEDNVIVATDGGLIRISGASNIVAMKAVSNSLLVFAINGVWQIIGGSDFGFSAENYQIVKVSEKGCLAPKSVVEVDGSVLYWSDEGVYIAEGSESGFFVAKDLTKANIKTFYTNIQDKGEVTGAYDKGDRSVRWLYDTNSGVRTGELVLRLDFGAWVVNDISKSAARVRELISTCEPPCIKYLTFENTGNDDLTFSEYNNTKFADWEDLGASDDASAYMAGAHFTGGDGSKAKQSPYVTFHLLKTETGFDENFEPLNPSSCLVQTSWDWSNNDNSNKQGKEFQAYKFRRHYMPADSSDGFDNGYETVVSKNKVRGRGKALSVTISTELEKDCKLIGWEQEMTINKD